jgi:hypothetical protein
MIQRGVEGGRTLQIGEVADAFNTALDQFLRANVAATEVTA